MRTKDTLFRFKEITTPLQYLYMDKDNTITFNNGVTDLCIRMDEDTDIFCKNLSYPNLPELYYTGEMSVSNMISIINELKTSPAIQYPEHFNYRWDEIECIVSMNLGLNMN